MNNENNGRRDTGSLPQSGARRLMTILGHLSPSAPDQPMQRLNTSTSHAQPKKPVTGHWVGNKPILPQHVGTRQESDYLLKTNMNIRHSSLTQFKKRAATYAKHVSSELGILNYTNKALQDPQSSVFQQSSHMVHTQRGAFWHRRQAQHSSPTSIASDVDTVTGKHKRRQGKIGDTAYDDLMDMMVSGKQGPLTMAQSQLGIEAAAAGHQLLRGARNQETQNGYKSLRVGARGRQGHPTEAMGVDLTNDLGTATREQLGFSVLMGTSGSTSDVVRSHDYATGVNTLMGSKTRFEPPGMSNNDATNATKLLAHRWMRTGAPAQGVSRAINKTLNTDIQKRISGGPLHATQTHTGFEISDAVDLTRAKIHQRRTENYRVGDTSRQHIAQLSAPPKPMSKL